MIFSSKRGMSPLIATVLLIAFAVAMGAMIMNWSNDIDQEGEGKIDFCEEISITTKNGACFGDNVISFSILNDGIEKVDGLLISIISEGISTDMKVKGTNIIKGETLDKKVPYLYSGGTIELEFIPLVETEEEEIVECRKGGFAQAELPIC